MHCKSFALLQVKGKRHTGIHPVRFLYHENEQDGMIKFRNKDIDHHQRRNGSDTSRHEQKCIIDGFQFPHHKSVGQRHCTHGKSQYRHKPVCETARKESAHSTKQNGVRHERQQGKDNNQCHGFPRHHLQGNTRAVVVVLLFPHCTNNATALHRAIGYTQKQNPHKQRRLHVLREMAENPA